MGDGDDGAGRVPGGVPGPEDGSGLRSGDQEREVESRQGIQGQALGGDG